MIHCLHGAVGSPRDWEPLRDCLEHEIHSIDLWPYLKKTTPSLEETGTLIADQANQGDILLGYSMGGRLALHALLADPQKWRAAIIVSAHPGLESGYEERLLNDAHWGNLARTNWDLFLQEWNAQSILSPPPRGLQQATQHDQAAVAQSFTSWSLGSQKNLLPDLHKIPCPVLWVTGENDQKFTQLSHQASKALQHSTTEIIPNCGHRVPWEQPGLFTSALSQFLT